MKRRKWTQVRREVIEFFLAKLAYDYVEKGKKRHPTTTQSVALERSEAQGLTDRLAARTKDIARG